MFKKAIIVSFMAILCYGCKVKEPYQPDYENALGVIVGGENCKTLSTANAWIIQFSGPNAGNKTYGESITFNGIVYSNAVKTFHLPDSSKVAGKRYLFEFYMDGKTNTQQCEVVNPTTFNLDIIRIKNIVRSRF